MSGFSKDVRKKLGIYVYLYVDPQTKKPFYVGKGSGNRAFSHIKANAKSSVSKILRELRKGNLKPRIEILRHGLTEKEAFQVEASAIELLDLDQLANEVHGHGKVHGPRAVWSEVENQFTAAEASILEPAILLNISRSYLTAVKPSQLYDVTRSAWTVNLKKAGKAKYAFAMYAGVVREVYKIQHWLKAGTTLTSLENRRKPAKGRWEFVGSLAPQEVRRRHIGKRVKGLVLSQNPVRYVNITRPGAVEE
jgi:hypothetical protein